MPTTFNTFCICLILSLTACAVDSPADLQPDAAPTLGATRTLTWSPTGMSNSTGEPTPIVCTAVVSHPCPYLLYTTELDLVPDLLRNHAGDLDLTWHSATGGNDSNGREVSTILPLPTEIDPATDTAIALPDRGDDGGLRLASTLTKNADGTYDGDVTWRLFTVAGDTTWHLHIGFSPAE